MRSPREVGSLKLVTRSCAASVQRRRALFPSRGQGVQGTRHRSSVPLGTAVDASPNEE